MSFGNEFEPLPQTKAELLAGNLGDEVLLDVIDHPKMKTVKANKGKEIIITSDGILRCKVYDLTENI